MKVLANDGISANAVDILNKNGFDVYLDRIEKNNLIDFINQTNIFSNKLRASPLGSAALTKIILGSKLKVGSMILNALPNPTAPMRIGLLSKLVVFISKYYALIDVCARLQIEWNL